MSKMKTAAMFTFPENLSKEQVTDLCDKICQRLKTVSGVEVEDIQVEQFNADETEACIYQP